MRFDYSDSNCFFLFSSRQFFWLHVPTYETPLCLFSISVISKRPYKSFRCFHGYHYGFCTFSNFSSVALLHSFSCWSLHWQLLFRLYRQAIKWNLRTRTEALFLAKSDQTTCMIYGHEQFVVIAVFRRVRVPSVTPDGYQFHMILKLG